MALSLDLQGDTLGRVLLDSASTFTSLLFDCSLNLRLQLIPTASFIDPFHCAGLVLL
jgi:hypothetical protein